MAVETITTTGSGTWTVPAGVTSVVVECWGGGRGGQKGNLGGGGGGGGGNGGDYARKTLSVTPGAGISYFVAGSGAAGTSSGAMGSSQDTWFSATGTLQARGGDRANTSVGDVIYTGGNGGNQNSNAGGGGGAGASSDGNGNAGSAASGGTPGAGGTGGTDGGAGGEGGGGFNNAAEASFPPGGGGGGGGDGFSSNNNPSAGSRGQIRITYSNRKAVRFSFWG